MRHTLLYVSYHHPSGGGSAAHRTSKLARQLQGADWDVLVLCGPSYATPAAHANITYRLLSVDGARGGAAAPGASPATKPIAVSERPTRLRSMARQMVFIPDPQIYWVPRALAAARRAFVDAPPSVVLCSGPPFSSFLLGRALKAMWRAPLVLDYRDVWLDHPWWPIPRWRRGLESFLQRRLLAAADLVVANHDAMRRVLLEQAPRAGERCVVVPNGFDPLELGPPVRSTWTRGEPFEMVYAGTLYGPVVRRDGRPDSLSVQQPAGLLQALRDLLERGVFGTGGVTATFVGARPWSDEGARLLNCAREYGVADRLRVLPRMDKSDVVPILRRAHLLLNILYDTEVQIAQKVYDYLHLEIPILSLLRGTEANASIVRQARAGPIVDPEKAPDIARAIESIVDDYAAGRVPVRIDRAFVDRFDVRVQARGLAERLLDVAEGRRVAGVGA